MNKSFYSHSLLLTFSDSELRTIYTCHIRDPLGAIEHLLKYNRLFRDGDIYYILSDLKKIEWKKVKKDE